jgi:hypothetical protein
MKLSNAYLAGIVCLLGAAVAGAAVTAPDTIDLSYQYVESGAVIDGYLDGARYYYGQHAAEGVMVVSARNASGPLASRLSSSFWVGCTEIAQSLDNPNRFNTYTVLPLASAFTADKAALVGQLWARYYDASWETQTPVYVMDWVAGQPTNTAQNKDAVALIYSIYEILWDYSGSMSSLDVTAGRFRTGPSQSSSDITPITQGMLSSLVPPGQFNSPLPELVVLTNPDHQDLITVVPEPATLALLAMGGVAMLFRRRT